MARSIEDAELRKYLEEINPSTGRPRKDDYPDGIKKLTTCFPGETSEKIGSFSAWGGAQISNEAAAWIRKVKIILSFSLPPPRITL